MMPHQPHFGYGYPQPPHSASSHTTETYPPSAYTSGTIQPSAFGGWASENRQRESTSTISTGLAPDDYSERRRSVVSVEGESEKEDDAWEQHSPLESVSEYSDSVNSSGTVRKVQPKKKKKQVKRREEHREGNVTYTTDAEVKQTPEVSFSSIYPCFHPDKSGECGPYLDMDCNLDRSGGGITMLRATIFQFRPEWGWGNDSSMSVRFRIGLGGGGA